MKKILSILLACCLLAGAVPALAVDAGEARAVIGSNLTEEQISAVYSNFGVKRGDVTELRVTNADERKYLEGYVEDSVIGTNSISCVYIEVLEAGEGLDVTTSNINWCTSQMYVSALATAGITDALQKRMRSLILIGMPGAGKTTVGRLLAQRLGRDFFDADEELERRFGCDIPTFFAREGEAVFRAEETTLLAELGKRSGCVIATGGGCVTRPENEPLLRQNAAVIWLQRALDRLPVAGRPVSRCTTPEALYAQRAAAYARFSDGTADNNGTPDETVRQILEAWT